MKKTTKPPAIDQKKMMILNVFPMLDHMVPAVENWSQNASKMKSKCDLFVSHTDTNRPQKCT